ncbi:translation machinery-associated protein 16 homolog [Arctopsyche grandis]|uniref:translation machinery-associated protein 16 homolog n=1 Tax=Arctopsyche grandis TaxID=121162 RepID=UPI00406D6CB9
MKPIQKEIAKCKHPNSRKTIALARKSKKALVKEENKLGRYIKQNVLGEKIVWFKDNLPETDASVYSKEEIKEMLDVYLARFDKELEEIVYKNSIGGKRTKQHCSRENAINMTKENESREYKTCGIEIPDLTNTSQVVLLKSWNGELRFLQNFKLRRFSISNLQ